ncbi:PilZ domain-containing protein [Streptohalobacillus salinus]|uniref:PilZ domain-containing protein n=1 Tax=Streptohalobacillus salinus TaxID=621096 RepID=A0A2V3W3R6_9BACI|nr:PilZ domain-containing protein [Streptohalobacillus salinus]PXW88973.1 PilZ domain-containing protein [Streptohalobacillus salinus]
MRYKRKEPFRYQFLEPVDGAFVILLNHEDTEKIKRTDSGAMKIIDISPKGMRFKSKLNLPTHKKEFLIEATFSLEGTTLTMLGKIAWKKEENDYYHYGIEGFEDAEREQGITHAVKEYSKRRTDGGGLV